MESLKGILNFKSVVAGGNSTTHKKIIISYVQDTSSTPPTSFINLPDSLVWYDKLGFTTEINKVNVWNNVVFPCYLTELVAVVPPRVKIVVNEKVTKGCDYGSKLDFPSQNLKNIEMLIDSCVIYILKGAKKTYDSFPIVPIGWLCRLWPKIELAASLIGRRTIMSFGDIVGLVTKASILSLCLYFVQEAYKPKILNSDSIYLSSCFKFLSIEIKPHLLALKLRTIYNMCTILDARDLEIILEFRNIVQKILTGIRELIVQNENGYKWIKGSELESMLIFMANITNVKNKETARKLLAIRSVVPLLNLTTDIRSRRSYLYLTIGAIYRAPFLKVYSEKDLAETFAGLSLWARKGDQGLIKLLQKGWTNEEIANELCKEEEILDIVLQQGRLTKFVPNNFSRISSHDFDFSENSGLLTNNKKIQIEQSGIVYKSGDLGRCLSPVGVGVASEILASWVFQTCEEIYVTAATSLQNSFNSINGIEYYNEGKILLTHPYLGHNEMYKTRCIKIVLEKRLSNMHVVGLWLFLDMKNRPRLDSDPAIELQNATPMTDSLWSKLYRI